MGLTTDAAVVNIEGNTKQLVDQINKADKAMQNFDKTLTDILSHLTAVENGLKNVNSITNNASKITNTVQTRYNRETYDFGKQSKITKSSAGFMSSNTGREKVYKEYQQAVIDETKEITADVAERKRLRKQRADAETTTANAAKLRASKLEDQTSARYLERMDKLADARLLNAKNNQAGALYRDPRYQTGKAFSAIGATVSSWGTGGKAAGLLLDSLGVLVKSPVAGAATAVSNLVKGVSDLGKASVQAYSEIEAIKTQLGVVFSNQTQADSMFGQISQYAVKSPFGVQQTSELAVLLKQSGVYASDLMDTLRMLGDTAGGNMEKMKRIANNYAQIVSIGKASMLDMRQFAYAGIPIFEAVSKELGVSQQQLRKLISDGKVTSDIIEKVFKDLTGINGLFENATEKGAKTLKARLQNLADARQLAFGSIGEWGFNFGTQTGNDSIANSLVSTAEGIYQYIKEHVNTVNIENSVKAIEERDYRISELQKLQQKYADNPAMLALMTRALGVELNKRDIDRTRTVYETSYQNKARAIQNTYRDFGVESFEELEQLAALVNKNAALQYRSYGNGGTFGQMFAKQIREKMDETAESLNINLEELYNMPKDEFNTLSEAIREAVEVIKESRDITAEEVKYHLESNAINAQQLAFDQENKRAEQTSSLNSKFQQLLEIYKESDEYKKKEEEKRIKTLTEAKEVLKKLAPRADSTGNLKFNQFSMPEFLRYDAQGAFSSGKKFNIVNGNKPVNEEDMKQLRGQVSYAMEEAQKQAYFYGDKRTALALKNEIDELNKNLNDEDYLNKFSKTLDNVKSLLDGSQLSDSVKKQIYDYIVSSSLSHELTVGGENADLTTTEVGKAADQFVPLWKRILAQYTGLSTQGMTGTLQTMANYRDDMAIRNMTSSVMSAAMKTMGIDSAMGLIRTSGAAKQLRGDTGATYQVDWKETRKAVKDFALSLSASTEVITAYKNSLEQELDVYEQLIAAGYTEAESQDLKNQKTVSVKTLEKLAQDAGDQLVNAFGEGFKTKSGKTAFFDGTNFVDEKGNKLQEEEIILTGNLFEFIKGELPRLRKEISEASVAESNKKMFDTALAEVLKTELGNRATNNATTRSGIVSGFLLDNPEYVTEQFNNIFTKTLEEYKDNPRYADLIGAGKTNVLSTAMMGTPEFLAERKAEGFSTDRYDAANELVKIALDAVVSAAERLGVGDSGSAYQNLKNYAAYSNFNSIVQNRYRTLSGTSGHQQLSLTAYPDQGGIGGTRGVTARALSNFYGLEKGYDLQALYEYGKKTGGDLKYKDTEVSWEAGAELTSEQEKLVEAAIRYNEVMKDTQEVTRQMGAGLQSAFGAFAKSAWEKPFEVMSKNLVLGKDATEGMEDAYKQLSGELLKASSEEMVKAGWALVARGAEDKNYGMIAGGLGLVAAGGVAAGLGSALTEGNKDKDKKDKQTEKLESLKSDLQKLLEQARSDALYYENNLRHQTALGINRQFSYKSVHDAILTPKGDVVTTDPKDYLIATKTPQQLVGGGNVTVQPVINCNVVNNSSAKVSQEQQVNPDGSIDIITLVEEIAGGYIASSKSDDAFASREYRMRGRQAVM